MLKRMLVFIAFILCVSVMCGCSNTALPTQSVDANTKLKVIRYPLFDETDNSDYSDYYESGLLYPAPSDIFDQNLKGISKRYLVSNKEYVATYYKSKIYSDNKSDFMKLCNYDEYVVEGKADFQVFRDTGLLKKVYIYRDELEKSEKIVTDFSETGLKKAALSMLTNLYGSDISQYLNSYYQFDYAKLMDYANDEINRYVICYRAYLNNIPTDDVIYVHFSLSGVFMGVSAKRYLHYIHVNDTTLKPINDIEKAIRDAVSELNYSRVSLREAEVPCYYTMNSNGELYYVMEWSVFKTHEEDASVTYVETMAVKAN